MNAAPECIFCKIVAGQIPAKKVHEDEELIAFHDIHPWAPVHVLIIPRVHIVSLAEATAEHEALLGRLLGLAPRLMKQLGVHNGFRTVINTGHDGGQEVQHLHMHVLGGSRPWLRG
ncbi:MAG: histidine triad nucleotide-binding protein [Rubrivivax sp.]|nr:histidine triad nucleotide-binding protein [Rubrivivax sp.]